MALLYKSAIDFGQEFKFIKYPKLIISYPLVIYLS